MTYKEARVYLDEMSRYGSVLGLDSIRGLLRELGNPQKDLKFIHIAGTNGKGSVLAYTSTVLSEAGYRTGRYVSPTVVSYLEKIQVDGTWISEEKFAEETEKVRDAIACLKKAGEPVPTVFEAETAIAFLYFKDTECDFVVLEAGLGGALDATNIVENTVCAVFTSISRDHIGVIGNTIEEIAENKAGIIKPGCAVISAPQKKEAEEILERRLSEAVSDESGTAENHEERCRFFLADPGQTEVLEEGSGGIVLSYKEFEGIRSNLSGACQPVNLITALETVRALRAKGYRIGTDAVKNGIFHTVWPGRFERIGEKPLFVLDGAHNEDAALKLSESVERYFSGRRLIFIMGVFRDKEYRRIAEIMAPLADAAYTVCLPNEERGLPAEELARTVREYCAEVTVCGAEDGQEESIKKAVRLALKEAGSEDVILAFGSLSYLEQVRKAYKIQKERGN